jgi:hypothetical protein
MLQDSIIIIYYVTLFSLTHPLWLLIQGLIYVSTAYSNCTVKEISERLYPVTHDPDEVIDLVQTLSDRELLEITPKWVII